MKKKPIEYSLTATDEFKKDKKKMAAIEKMVRIAYKMKSKKAKK